MAVIAYFISFRGYGTWLHGREGSVDGFNNTYGKAKMEANPLLEESSRGAMKQPVVELEAERRFVVDATIREVCEHRGWQLHAIQVRATHVHVVVTAVQTPERVMNDLKAYCTRRMREAGVLGRDVEPWSYHGSTRYLDTGKSFGRAIVYVMEEQGPALEMRCPAGWRDRAPRAGGA